MLVRLLQLEVVVEVALEVGRVGERCRLLPITACGSSHSVTATPSRPSLALADPRVAADEVDEVRAEGQHLRQPGVVVVVRRDVAVGALPRLVRAHGVREVGVEGLAR